MDIDSPGEAAEPWFANLAVHERGIERSSWPRDSEYIPGRPQRTRGRRHYLDIQMGEFHGEISRRMDTNYAHRMCATPFSQLGLSHLCWQATVLLTANLALLAVPSVSSPPAGSQSNFAQIFSEISIIVSLASIGCVSVLRTSWIKGRPRVIPKVHLLNSMC
jgi:hypothetical protein